MKTLKDYVKNWIKDQELIEQEVSDLLNDVLEHGCQSGIVSELIYYSDTLPFFEKYKEEINELLTNTMSELGSDSPVDVFGDKWDKDDNLALETNNRNLLAWFAFEETVREMSYELESA